MALLLGIAGLCPAQSLDPPTKDATAESQPVAATPDTLTNDWFGAGEQLRDSGITSTLNIWSVYQANVSGGLDTDDDTTALTWFTTRFDLERLAGIQGGTAYLQVEGGWGDGINDSVGASMGVNGIASSDDEMGITRLWYEQAFADSRVRVRAGKLDVTTENFDFHGHSVAMDAMPFANTPRTQFLNSGLVNNTAVPFPSAGLGGVVVIEPVDRGYVSAAGFDRNTNKFSTNFSDAFTDMMVMVETGVVVEPSAGLTGLYFIGYWYSTFPDDPDAQGIYLGATQHIYREPGTEQQGLGIFARYGYGDQNPSGVDHFWSLGLSYQGLLPGRDSDILGLGWAQAYTSGTEFSESYEGALEFYYRAMLTPWFHLGPHAQYIVNPGSTDVDDAVTVGARGQITF